MKTQQGFTLLEILVVVIIVSILSVMGVQLLNSGSVERVLQKHGRILQASIEYACDQAVLQNLTYGFLFSKHGYAFFRYANREWSEVSSETLFHHELTDGSKFRLEVDGQTLVLDDEIESIPQIMCAPDGQLTDFRLIISDSTENKRYQLNTINFWQLEGKWIDASKI